MNRAQMRESFRENAAQLADALSDGQVNTYLNRAYSYEIPADVGGELSEGIWTLTCVASTGTYAYPYNMIAPRGNAWISSDGTNALQSFLTVVTEPEVFENVYAHIDGASEAQPSAALFHARQVRLSPVPDAAYVVKIPARMGPTELDTDTFDVENEAMSKAVVHAAVRDFAGEVGDEETEAIQMRRYERYRDILQSYAQSRPRTRRPARSF